jgi:hypothetical protein
VSKIQTENVGENKFAKDKSGAVLLQMKALAYEQLPVFSAQAL